VVAVTQNSPGNWLSTETWVHHDYVAVRSFPASMLLILSVKTNWYCTAHNHIHICSLFPRLVQHVALAFMIQQQISQQLVRGALVARRDSLCTRQTTIPCVFATKMYLVKTESLTNNTGIRIVFWNQYDNKLWLGISCPTHINLRLIHWSLTTNNETSTAAIVRLHLTKAASSCC